MKCSNAGNSSASVDEFVDYDNFQGSSLLRSNDDDAGEESNFDEGDGNDISKVDDLEVKMDLTDDLLHMVMFWETNSSCAICCQFNRFELSSYLYHCNLGFLVFGSSQSLQSC